METESALPVTQLLAGFTSALSWEGLPESVRTEAKLAIADTVVPAIFALAHAAGAYARELIATHVAKFTRRAARVFGAENMARCWENAHRLEQLSGEQVAALY